ncbi:UDP-N-acetylglucosamine 2-epimerase (non-hydrolyzing) [Neolewinella lacunae]|uniref:non-hydrolyzing UDP-N-acetylglucosamine 2-epimerase n=1 Tax=Neolewinella lacunae TaxID=1517758 RepID=UPI001CA3BA8F|nr:UDP-N-acetylglucosamine 2-epimerase (non-hydrolyzing) [Neolewinella lacunae]MDN3636724.1 UDP-N-acetylglucosamine 2-epimerase (non-hydrolyzing) [Neolewinella lacunae]
MIKILSVVGARPNFMKVAPLHRAFVASGQIDSRIVHTGQHYDAKMSDIFFNQLGLPEPHFHLGVGGGSHTYQKANVMLKFEEVLLAEQPDLVLVVGDVNATTATTLVAVKMGIPVAHVEAGLRSGDRTMPEEVNRVVTDAICQYHFVTEHSGLVNLARENTLSRGIHLVGNVMIDSLIHFREKAAQEKVLEGLGLAAKSYLLTTMHRPHNVDGAEGLGAILDILRRSARRLPVVFPMHPRTRNNFAHFGLLDEVLAIENLHLLEPQGYLQFLQLMDNARLIVTDSGGIQEETTYLQVPCLTFRDTTERPITVELGTNLLLADLHPDTVLAEIDNILAGRAKTGIIPPLWDGRAAERIRDILLAELGA